VYIWGVGGLWVGGIVLEKYVVAVVAVIKKKETESCTTDCLSPLLRGWRNCA